MKILIIGGGNMGSAIALSLKNNLKSAQISICERDQAKLAKFKSLKIKTYTDISKQAVDEAEIIIIAVKPQNIHELCAPLKNFIDNQLIVSIAAGITLDNLTNKLGTDKLIRVMPNTPALIGEGISGWIAAKGASESDKKILKTLLSCFGEEVEIKDEIKLNAVTALSGCGPAYVFYFLNALIESAKKLNLSEKNAKKLAFKTFSGAIKLAESSKDDLETLIKNVASKGGSTEAALKVFDENKLDKTIGKALKRANQRAEEMSRESEDGSINKLQDEAVLKIVPSALR